VLESSGDRTTWSYDPTYQLNRERRSGLTTYDVTYTYDPAGNRMTQTDTGTRTTYAYDMANQLLTEKSSTTTTYTYDACGNRIEKNAFAGITFYNWDEKSRMTRAVPPAGPVTLTYNADGHRVAKTTATQVRKFVYDFEKVLQETDGTNTTNKEYTSTDALYGKLLSDYTGGQSTYYEYDGLGSTDALVSDAQTATDRYRYRAFGLSTQYQGSSPNDFTYVGQQGYFSDPEISLYFVRARYYDYAIGRWVSEDPAGFRAGDSNLYRYVGNGPTNRTDPAGLQDLSGAELEVQRRTAAIIQELQKGLQDPAYAAKSPVCQYYKRLLQSNISDCDLEQVIEQDVRRGVANELNQIFGNTGEPELWLTAINLQHRP
jgi:RHS repeat-associated protein